MLVWQATKDPLDVLDYYFSWQDFLLPDELIISYVLTSNNAAVINSSFNDGRRIGIWISGGTSPSAMVVNCVITTNQGRTADRSAKLEIRQN
jgi:hypothetical protein